MTDSKEIDPDILKKIKAHSKKSGKKGDGWDAHPLRFLDDYFPEKHDIAQKGRLKQALTVRFSAVDAIFYFFPEVKHLEPIVKAWANQIETRLVSVDGASRDEFMEILIALLHGYRMEEDTDESSQSFFKQIFDASSNAGGDNNA